MLFFTACGESQTLNKKLKTKKGKTITTRNLSHTNKITKAMPITLKKNDSHGIRTSPLQKKKIEQPKRKILQTPKEHSSSNIVEPSSVSGVNPCSKTKPNSQAKEKFPKIVNHYPSKPLISSKQDNEELINVKSASSINVSENMLANNNFSNAIPSNPTNFLPSHIKNEHFSDITSTPSVQILNNKHTDSIIVCPNCESNLKLRIINIIDSGKIVPKEHRDSSLILNNQDRKNNIINSNISNQSISNAVKYPPENEVVTNNSSLSTDELRINKIQQDLEINSNLFLPELDNNLKEDISTQDIIRDPKPNEGTLSQSQIDNKEIINLNTDNNHLSEYLFEKTGHNTTKNNKNDKNDYLSSADPNFDIFKAIHDIRSQDNDSNIILHNEVLTETENKQISQDSQPVVIARNSTNDYISSADPNFNIFKAIDDIRSQDESNIISHAEVLSENDKNKIETQYYKISVEEIYKNTTKKGNELIFTLGFEIDDYKTSKLIYDIDGQKVDDVLEVVLDNTKTPLKKVANKQGSKFTTFAVDNNKFNLRFKLLLDKINDDSKLLRIGIKTPSNPILSDEDYLNIDISKYFAIFE